MKSVAEGNGPLTQCLGSLLHIAHATSRADAKNALLMYCGLRMLQRVRLETGYAETRAFNDACWQVKHLIDATPICFAPVDPINFPTRPIPFTVTTLLLPNNTELDSSSTLVMQARKTLPHKIEDDKESAELGALVRTVLEPNDYYDSLKHIVCRKPGDPALRGLSTALANLEPGGAVAIYSVPVFGSSGEDFRQWADGLSLWANQRSDIQRAACFINLCFIKESKPVAERIAESLKAAGVEYCWQEPT